MARDFSMARKPTGKGVPRTIDGVDHFDATREHPEERPVIALVRGVLPRLEADIGRGPREPLTGIGIKVREDLDRPDLLRGHHSYILLGLGPLWGDRRTFAQLGGR
jgi:hypothetical protein